MVQEGKVQIRKKETTTIKTEVEKESWVALKHYFNGAGNGPEAKIAVVVLGTLAKEAQSRNNSRQLDIMEQRLLAN